MRHSDTSHPQLNPHNIVTNSKWITDLEGNQKLENFLKKHRLGKQLLYVILKTQYIKEKNRETRLHQNEKLLFYERYC